MNVKGKKKGPREQTSIINAATGQRRTKKRKSPDTTHSPRHQVGVTLVVSGQHQQGKPDGKGRSPIRNKDRGKGPSIRKRKDKPNTETKRNETRRLTGGGTHHEVVRWVPKRKPTPGGKKGKPTPTTVFKRGTCQVGKKRRKTGGKKLQERHWGACPRLTQAQTCTPQPATRGTRTQEQGVSKSKKSGWKGEGGGKRRRTGTSAGRVQKKKKTPREAEIRESRALSRRTEKKKRIRAKLRHHAREQPRETSSEGRVGKKRSNG